VGPEKNFRKDMGDSLLGDFYGVPYPHTIMNRFYKYIFPELF
jgi:hypothetical protein